jgi:Pyruvate/2-oxoacid:ferredoxin oxidoreductase delta subunit
MKIELKYFTGTGNSLKVLNTCKDVFIENNHSVSISAISQGEKLAGSDIIGFCFPVYAFAIPRIARKYLIQLKRFNIRKKVFVIITSGDDDESGFSVQECENILEKKNCQVIYSRVVQMPINWTTSPTPPYPPSKEEALKIIENGVIEAKKIAQDILNGVTKHHAFNYPKRFSWWGFYWEYWLFRYLGVQNMWRTFKVYETCNSCQICSKVCPTKSIKMADKKPVWASTCEQCMRCVNFCPNESIYQSFGGETKGKNKYFEPGFKPF